jgi:serine/threonine protein kinase
MMLALASDAAVGMNFLHQSRIIHRDLKSGNMLVTQGFRVKICDFGISRSVDQQQTNMTGNLGTVPWTAPEMLKGERYDEKVDVYAFGICVWEIVRAHALPACTRAYAVAEPEVP